MRRLALVIILSSLLSPLPAHAADYQQCETSSTCTIGEFLYDDAYAALPGQTCTLNAKYPAGTAFITGQTMTDRGDGWYSYDAAIGTTEGLYSATICCTPGGATMCLDKSFEVTSPPASAPSVADIWSYSGRTLTSYGTLVTDIWSATTRSLTSFGSLVGDIWGYSGRTMTGFGTLITDIWGSDTRSLTTNTTTDDSLSAVLVEQKTQRELLEKLVNAPIISLSLDEGESVPDLETKLEESKKQAGLLYDLVSSSKSRLMVLDTKWDRLSKDAAAKEITAISALFQDSAPLIALSKSWDTPSVASLNLEVASLQSTLADFLTSTSLNKSNIPPKNLITSLETLDRIETSLGDSTNVSSDKTLFGYLSSVSERNASLSGEGQKLAALLENLNGQGVNNATREVGAIKDRLLTLNQYPGGASLASPAKVSSDAKLNLKNILFSLQALVGLNRQILAMNVGDPVRSLWLEEGSIIFRAIITNPSAVITQSVPLKFYLPRELKVDDIITLDPSLTTTYDPIEDALFATGTYELKPKETQLVYVEVEDVWRLSDAELQTLRVHAQDLLKPLEKTAYFSQGTTLKSNIDVTLDKVILLTGKAVTPENRIRSYRESRLELAKVEANMTRLEDLVAQASGTGSVFGFVGGVQTVAVWGIILVVVAGFVFLALYFRKLQPAHQPADEPLASSPAPTTHLSPLTSHLSSPRPSWQMPAIIAAVVVATAGTTILLTQLAKPESPPVINQVDASPVPSPSPVMEATPSAKPSDTNININSEKSVLGQNTAVPDAELTVPEDSSVNLRNAPSSTADIIMAVKETQDVYIFAESGEWRHIGFAPSDAPKEYWVHSKFISQK